ncbi:MAG: enoyl-CoA hydratase [Kordiimonadales bacterium]|nr:MAG: enoyl-CoA hydratase [Kordiimonadales bacterium]
MPELENSAETLFEVRGNIGLITLNRPKALNSLTHGMCVAISAQLAEWKVMPAVQAVVVVGSGEKAFCAGGDVVKVSKSVAAGTREWRDFFHDEYLMNIAIAEFPKPYISLVDGIAMGGGVGVSIPGDFWVATEKTMFAMPETGLGLIPDVGGGWFLPRLPGEVGMFLALTGARIKAPDLYALGIASHVVAADQIEAVIGALSKADIKSNADVKDLLDGFHKDTEPAPLSPHFDDVDDHFDNETVEQIISSLENDQSEWAQKQLKVMGRKSPLSMKVTFEQLKRGAACETFRENMQMEFRIVSHAMDFPDFHEGVRAILIDKDNRPAWNPATLGAVADADVLKHFENLGADELALN